MTIKNRRKHARRELLRNKSLIERMKKAQLAHDIVMFRMQQTAHKALEELKHKAKLELNEYKKQAEAYL